jgi:hypothetical protein
MMTQLDSVEVNTSPDGIVGKIILSFSLRQIILSVMIALS